MNGKSKKVIETEKWVEEYIRINRQPPTYREIQERFDLSACAAWNRCKKFRDKMKNTEQSIKLGRYDLLEQRIAELENKIEQLIPTIN